ncbi:MAG: hypothetical protein R3Y35_05265 [Clostridia bacterium]
MKTILKKSQSGSALCDNTYMINKAVLNAENNCEIALEKDNYTISPKYAYEKFIYMTNNDFGLKNILFPIIDKSDITIDGNGSSLNFLGRLLPFYISNSKNITIKNFTIDYQRPMFSQAKLLEIGENDFTMEIDKEIFPYTVKDGILIFVGEDYESDFVHGILAFDPETKRPLSDSIDCSIWNNLIATELSDGVLKINYKLHKCLKVGQTITIKHERRYVPAIAINECENVVLENITIRHAGTMGVVAQFSKDITIKNMEIATDKNSSRVMSVNADATHFVGCTGTILVENSKFESMLDDIINVHGNYLKVTEVIDSKNVIAEIPHRQQVGAYGIKNNATISFLNADTMLLEGKAVLKSTNMLNNKYYEMKLEEDFEFDKTKTYCVENTDAYPQVIFRNNDCGRNRARALLLTSAKNILIENNKIDCEGAAFKISADMTGWYESGATNNVVIKNNIIKRSNMLTWGKAIFDIDPEMEVFEDNKYFHDTILVQNNKIELCANPLVYGKSFKTLIFENNEFYTAETNILSEDDLVYDVEEFGEIKLLGNNFVNKKLDI